MIIFTPIALPYPPSTLNTPFPHFPPPPFMFFLLFRSHTGSQNHCAIIITMALSYPEYNIS